MTDTIFQPRQSVRQRIAARTPHGLRRLARMALNYPYRIRTWLGILVSLRPVGWGSRKTLWVSAASALVSSFRNLDSFQKPVPVADLDVDVAGIGRFAIRAGTDDLLHLLPSREQKVRDIIEQRIRPGAVFVDGGANIGFYSILAARLVGPGGRVVAFEMMPDTAAVLRRHIAMNGARNIEVVERALSDRSVGRVRASVEPGQHGQASIVKGGSERHHSIEVETITLDEALADCGAIDLIKLDLEGAEYPALRGAAAVLVRTACVVFESNDRDERIFDLLAHAGFVVEHLEGSDFLALRSAP